ncbi:MAG TPA: tRNA (adenosine(37)-N6)-dimethylallyltransferase MiaA [Saprospiraceae bacterium]|nr:tRNA (adenosine(37)-N6)-dimethylallyltransferase MiaA [Saprospiraceae bacterium]
MKNTLLVIDGPTAGGKTDLAFQWACELACPILSADSRQIFCDVTIGTCKPSEYILKTVKHYFINHIQVDASYSVGQYEQEVNILLEELFKLHPVLILCGGTGLYIKSIIKGMDQIPLSSEEVKLQSQSLLEEQGIDACRKILAEVDPSYYATVDLNNSRRILRALEVYFESGQAFSSFLNKPSNPKPYNIVEICLVPERAQLYSRIEARVDQMILEGLFDEAKSLISYRHCQALKTVGYRESFDYLDGTITKARCIELIKQNSRNYAKRQITWFKKELIGTQIDSTNPQEIKNIRNQLDKLFPR